jgi:hypothetical protein
MMTAMMATSFAFDSVIEQMGIIRHRVTLYAPAKP